MTRITSSVLFTLLLTSLLVIGGAKAQSNDIYNGLYGKIGIGFSDYTGDFPVQNSGHPWTFKIYPVPSVGPHQDFHFYSTGS